MSRALTVILMSLAVLLPSYTEASSRRHEAVIHIGMLTAIMIGVSLLAQVGFAGYLHGRPRKKPFLMMGIHVRVAALAGAAVFWLLKKPNRRGDTSAGGGRGDVNAGPRYWDIMRSVPAILRSDQTLRNYILASNLLGLDVTPVPFYVALGRNKALRPKMSERCFSHRSLRWSHQTFCGRRSPRDGDSRASCGGSF